MRTAVSYKYNTTSIAIRSEVAEAHDKCRAARSGSASIPLKILLYAAAVINCIGEGLVWFPLLQCVAASGTAARPSFVSSVSPSLCASLADRSTVGTTV